MKKWIFLIFALLIISAILFLYVAFNGNIISKAYAKHLIKDYTEEVYTDAVIAIEDGHYNFKDSKYTFRYTVFKDTNSWEYFVSIGGPFIPSKKTLYAYLNEEDEDPILTATYRKEGAQHIQTLLQEQAILTTRIDYFISVPKGLYSGEQAWLPSVDSIITPEIFIEIKDEQQTLADFTNQVQTIQQILKDEAFTYKEATASIVREYDNAIEQREGYANTFYETLFSVQFNPNSPIIHEQDIRQ